ncbi:Protein of unknown function (DUF3224) [Mycolicibacterium rhodesiae NBB3]|uniref:DUF3224 domain-containing protein n=1 Tax=Mycolicibacterium rhodesiae (strain NBB3) TaxID=710685 RepID=G8RWB5_MYCRN|nr:DUF3224 domain-containing protein [Mycolicibacterium rhodesiae]AEV73047.1 Protein of unknown function (DUF3224) [Mycolicibacterium rhodesiae NBB3]
MTTQINALFEIASWDETPFEDGDSEGDEETKLTEALVKKRYSGDIDATSTTKWLMAYAPDKSATYVGVEHVTGIVGGRRGGLVLMHDGKFTDGVATAVIRVVSGTGELAGATGSGTFRADPAGSVVLDLDG